MKKLLFLLALIPLIVSAEGAADPSVVHAEYLFHLYFDSGNIYADRDYQIKYDIITEDYVSPTLSTGFPYMGQIINMKGQVTANFKFDPRNGNSNFNTGKISVKAPYIPDAQKVIFYDPQNNTLLSISVDQSSICNDDGLCNADRGESYQTCPNDCKATDLTSVSETPTPVPARSSSSGGLIQGILYTVVGIALLVCFWWFLKRKSSTPPTPPMSGNRI